MPRSRLFIWLLKKGFPLRIFFSKFTRVPLLGRILGYMLFHENEMIYLPKDDVTTIKVNQTVDQKGDMVVPSDILKHFIEEANYHVIMDWCICRSSLKCEHYPIELGCLFLGEAAMRIDSKLGRKVTKEEALEHAEKCREAGLVHVIGRDKLDAVWLKVGPGEKLLTVCNCCECCCLWKILPHVSKKISSRISIMPGVRITVGDACIGCGTCQNICFVKAITLIDKKAVISDSCRGCGRCVSVCPQKAIKISVEGIANLDESVNIIKSVVDVT